ncbi:hypothetical protein WMF45_31590 [Sorangium sp. So ce448]|uniref:hypothetical protein n=1 Tax=Sorangium sp. So ce448 TaxID=3133314 RepID=UPI003F616704
MTAIRTVLSMAALLGALALATPATAESDAPPSAQSTAPSGYAPSPAGVPPGYAPPGYAPPGHGPPGHAPPGYALPPGYPPPPDHVPPGYVPYAPSVILGMPRTLTFTEGGIRPAGYRVETQMNRRLVVAGSIVLASAWALSALTAGSILSEGGSDAVSYSPMLVPVGGPFITLGTGEDVDVDRDDGRLAAALLLFDGATQVTGFALLVAGLVGNQRVWVRDDIPSKVSVQAPELTVGPTGATLRMSF